MPRKATGSVFLDHGRRYVRVTLGNGAKDRPAFLLPESFDDAAAEERREVLADLASRLRATELPRAVAMGLLERAAAADTAARLDDVLDAAERFMSGKTNAARRPDADITFEALGRQWTSGELHRLFPQHVDLKKKPHKDAEVLAKHVYPIVGHVRVVAFGIDDADAVLRALPVLEPSTVREIAGRMLRILSLAVFPLRLMQATPIPRGWMPKRGLTKAKGYLFPSEDALFLGCVTVPLCWRVTFGFLNREGPRFQEAAALTWSDFNLDAGMISLDAFKTDDARDWLLNPDVARAMRAWKRYRLRTAGAAAVAPDAPVFVNVDGGDLKREKIAAVKLRRFLARAGIDRAQLFERSKLRRPLRAHDTRATFVTLALANGKTETWVKDRTGHKRSDQIETYRRAARSVAEMSLGSLVPLDTAIPELAPWVAGIVSGNGSEVPADVANTLESMPIGALLSGTCCGTPCRSPSSPSAPR